MAVYVGSVLLLPAAASLNPANMIALCALFFGGLRLWPVVLGAALIGGLLGQVPDQTLVVSPVIAVAFASAGSYLLRRVRLDPLFRHMRDAFATLAVLGFVSLLVPTVEAATSAVGGLPYTLGMWGYGYVATLSSSFIVVPLILRWSAKPRFRRTLLEAVETVGIFILLIGIDWMLFVDGTQTILGIYLMYLPLIPLFVIALRLRPRFVTLALCITSLFAIAGTLASTESVALAQRLFEVELFLIALSASFLLISSLAEDRRVNRNIMFSQLATLENMLARVSSESRAKNDFIAILAHELRNPLAPIVSTIDLLQLKGPRDAEEKEGLDMMADRMATVRRLLDDLLDVSRISEGKISLKKEQVELESALKSAILSTEHHRKELHQTLVFRGANRPLYVAGDSVRIEQIFSNLLTNASKYSNSGDTITLLVREEQGLAEIEVSDEGVGLSPHALETIFLPFQQIEQGERSEKGLGIGLALVRNFVEMHGGAVSAESEGIGAGSRFTVRLPVLPADDISITEEHQGSKPAKAPKKPGPLVLIVDDNDAAAAGIGRLLELQGYSVAYAYDGKEAIENTFSLSPAAVLLDIGLPDQDGYAVAKKLRKHGFTGRIIALTGYSTGEAKKHFRNSGIDDYLVKPAGLVDLRRVLPEL
ncbi:hypothetical protein A2763_02295 [Candidatus Kaiserbacteria bacterium RIFCSPHIGHO2_01_FULL_54_36]|uniref:histidine kinase n=1 Tax=Candidatus Kaiserbacteria bacterium RIFCSPHIGHO2_01_FULL_54_36 TaxID=1798482 RepID=A0A1F6CNZ2_9BACT|nr:MAG: hypothetical protein A2763_02295 [Candidatus Kaiserbacteria bacterium RIFCSPHIGHO2_01_FULL_54_36]OGG75990.1 MAG: hypothetical protein A3A41_03400 [Candidatus Kaiserbacteria bacterium RIFCSPLOWO2_01_FULL_54_22]